MATPTTTVGQRLSLRVTKWLQDNDRSVAWLARTIGVRRTTLAHQITVGKFPVDTALLIAAVIDSPLEDLVAAS